MTSDVATLKLRVDAREARSAAGELDRLGKAAQTADRGAAKLTTTMRGFARTVGAVTGSLVAREILQVADAYNLLNARIGLVSRGQTDFTKAQLEVFRVSQQTRVGLQQTADLYTALARSTSALGVNQSEVVGVLQAINQTLAISGTSAQSAAAALFQLGQGFASGTLRGEELNSVLEQAPRLAQAIADGLGVPIGKLRELGQAGELTAGRVFQAIQKSSDKLQTEFEKLPLTVEGALTKVGNSLSRLIGKIDEATGATRGLALVFSGLSGVIDDVTNLPEKARVAGLASDVLKLDKELKNLRANRDQRLGRSFLFGDVDKEIADVERKLKQAKVKFKVALGPVAGNSLFADDNQLPGEARRLGLTPPALVTDAAPGKGSSGRNREDATVNAAQRYLESLQDQLRSMRDLSAEEEILAQIQLGRLGDVTPLMRAQLVEAAKMLDQTRAQKQEEQELRSLRRAASIASGLELERENDAFNSLIERLESDTPSVKLEQQRQVMLKLAEAYQLGRFGIVGSEQAAQRYGEVVKVALGEVTTVADKQKSVVEQLGLTFSSAFEDAVVGGKGLRGVLKGLEQDLLRIFTRKLVTEPLSGAISGAFKTASTSGGGFFGAISSFFGSLFGAPARADGGPVSAGGLYQVNERGPELLDVAGKQFLMMGNQSGHVTPNAGTQPQMIPPIVNNFSFAAPVDRRTQEQVAAAAGRSIQRALSRGTA